MRRFLLLKRGPDCLSTIGFSASGVGFCASVGGMVGSSSALVFTAPSPFLGRRLVGIAASVRSGFVVSTVGKVIPSRGVLMTSCFTRCCGIPVSGVTIVNNPYRTRRVTLRQLSCVALTYPGVRGTETFSSMFGGRCLGGSYYGSIANVRCTSMLGGMCTVITNVYRNVGCKSGFLTIFVYGTVRRVHGFLGTMRNLRQSIASSMCLNSLLMATCSHFDQGHAFKAVVKGNCSIGVTRLRVRVVTRKCCKAGYVQRVGRGCGMGVPVLSALCDVLCRGGSPAATVQRLARAFGWWYGCRRRRSWR